ncbi:hypothetical protein NPIL_215481 [Nephila pilipes]|uniref:Uncharacterized protein n=1 Tax=Nephila pilipes TaxID=299642 RepID=A0A8X6TVU3_NEPPI|nr:hypothetical protein NPIL_215481 [Nephila pilipes]
MGEYVRVKIEPSQFDEEYVEQKRIWAGPYPSDREGIRGLPVFHLERVLHHQTVLPAPGCLERTRSPVPRSVDGVCSNIDEFCVRIQLASFLLPSGQKVSDMPANDGMDENHRS